MTTTNRAGGRETSSVRSSSGGSRSTGSRGSAGSGRSAGSRSSTGGSRSAGSRSGAGSGRTTASRSASGSRGSSYGGSSVPYRSYSSRRRKKSPDFRIIAIVGIILILVIAAVVFGMKGGGFAPQESADESTTVPTEPETELQQEVTVDGVTITGMSREQAKEEILKKYPWAMKVSCQGDVYEVPNLMSEKVEALLADIYTSSGSANSYYSLDTSGLEDAVAEQVAAMAERWDKAPKNGAIASYDSANDSFSFAGEEVGIAIDQEKLKSDMQAALSSKKFDAAIQVAVNEVQPEISQANAQNLYKTLGSYTTNTTNNSKRNTNVKLAAQTLNGTIVQPGEELSFNDTVGERTEAKGYQSAAAYNNGEVVQEIGGGVCQVSTTLYNAVVKSGLKVSKRQSHTFEPSYVTPGQDATVSWGGPDFRFINNSKSAIGIKASYYNQTVTVSIYGIPVLEDGVTQYLESKKLSDIDPPAPTYEEDQTLQPDQEVTVSSGSKGSRWETRLIVKKNGEIISNEVDHTVTYKGHNPVIRRNTSGVVIGGESTEDTSSTDTANTDAGMVQVGPNEWEAAPQPGSSSGTGVTQPAAPEPGQNSGSGSSGGPGTVTQPAPPETSPNVPISPGGDSGGMVVAPPPQ